MKIKFLGLFLLMFIYTGAQNHWVGVTGGLDMTNVKTKNFLDFNNNFRYGFTGGVTYEYFLGNSIYVGADFLYQQRGFADYFTFVDEFNVEIGKGEMTWCYDYFSVPIKVGGIFGRTFYGFASIGVVPAWLNNAKIVHTNTDRNSLEQVNLENVSIKKNVSKFDLAGFAELGVGYRINKNMCAIASVSGQYSFTSITNVNYFPNSDIMHYGMAFNLGMRYALSTNFR